MKKILIIILLLLTITLTGCKNKELKSDKETPEFKEELNKESGKTMQVVIKDKSYTINLTDNKAVEELIKILPLEVTMTELNGNEKYIYLAEQFTTNEYNPKHIEKGDVMLFGDNCLVIFYKSLDSTYPYTKIGHIDNLDDLGNGNIKVKISK